MTGGSRVRRRPRSRPLSSSANRIAGVEHLEDRLLLAGDAILHWNAVALQAVADDHTPWIVSSPDQGGPTRTARALAIVHAAMYDALNSIAGGHTPYLIYQQAPAGASADAAVGQAAHDTLVKLYPKQKAKFDAELQAWLAQIPNGKSETDGIAVGKAVANAILTVRKDDGSDLEQTHQSSLEPGRHQPDPLHPDQGLLTPKWGKVSPFGVKKIEKFHAPPPPALDSLEYLAAFNEVYNLGGDGVNTPTTRTAKQSQIGIFWGYDGSPGLGTPPRLYNQIARTIAVQRGNTEADNARLFALLNIAMADAGIASWYSKYEYDFWRPIVGIRNAHLDGNPLTQADPNWMPLGAPASNMGGTNFTPPFPAYTSGHATFGAAAFGTLRHFFGTDKIKFSFTSDEFNGVTKDQNGQVRPVVTRTYKSLSQATMENAVSRIYLGIHWRFDATDGINQGNAIAKEVFKRLLQPVVRSATSTSAMSARTNLVMPFDQMLLVSFGSFSLSSSSGTQLLLGGSTGSTNTGTAPTAPPNNAGSFTTGGGSTLQTPSSTGTGTSTQPIDDVFSNELLGQLLP